MLRRHPGRLAIFGATVLVSTVGTLVTPAAASPGDNGPLAVTMLDPRVETWRAQSQVWTVRPDGTDLHRQFPSLEEDNRAPIWSPDGRWLAFGRREALVIARPDGSDARVISERGGDEASWSPDGTQLVWAQRDDGQDSQIWVINADGTDRHLIFEDGLSAGPKWSPTGDAIVFMRMPEDPVPPHNDNDPEIFTMDPMGGHLQQLTDNFDDGYWSRAFDYQPSWSPDGSKIAFVSTRDAARPKCDNCANDLYVMDADGSNVTRIPDDGNENQPTWSPDGLQLGLVAEPTPPFPNTEPKWFQTYDFATGEFTNVARYVTGQPTIDWGAVPGSMPLADLHSSLHVDSQYTRTDGNYALEATMTNAGPQLAVDAYLTFRLPSGAHYTNSGSEPCVGEEVVRCALGDVASGDTRTLTVRASAGDAGVAEVSAMATSDTADPDVFNNRATVSVATCSDLGTPDADVLTGTDGDDVLCGVGGADRIYAGAGDDTILGGAGDDVLLGGTGNDTVSYGVALGSASVNLATGLAAGEGRDHLSGLENVEGSRFSDTLQGDGSANVLAGGLGADHLSGGLGADRVLGGDGADTLVPGSGDDRVDGGRGGDLVDYSSAQWGVTVDLRRRNSRGSGRDQLHGIESARGSRFSDVLIGTVVANRLDGGVGADEIIGIGGNDYAAGGDGRDLLDGGDGNDRLVGGRGIDGCAQGVGTGVRVSCERRAGP